MHFCEHIPKGFYSRLFLVCCLIAAFGGVLLLFREAVLISFHGARFSLGQCYLGALEFLTGTYDLRAIGPLAEIYWLRDIPDSVSGALTRLLRVQTQMQVSAAFTERQRRCLHRILALKKRDEIDLQLAILDFVETFGDVRALPAVRAIVEDQTRSPRLQTTALRCQAMLHAQQAATAKSQTLLRGATAPAPAPEQLLHPAGIVSEPPPEQLLRAVTNADQYTSV